MLTESYRVKTDTSSWLKTQWCALSQGPKASYDPLHSETGVCWLSAFTWVCRSLGQGFTQGDQGLLPNSLLFCCLELLSPQKDLRSCSDLVSSLWCHSDRFQLLSSLRWRKNTHVQDALPCGFYNYVKGALFEMSYLFCPWLTWKNERENGLE